MVQMAAPWTRKVPALAGGRSWESLCFGLEERMVSGQGIVCSEHTRCLGSLLCEQVTGERGCGWEQEGIGLPPVGSPNHWRPSS